MVRGYDKQFNRYDTITLGNVHKIEYWETYGTDGIDEANQLRLEAVKLSGSICKSYWEKYGAEILADVSMLPKADDGKEHYYIETEEGFVDTEDEWFGQDPE